MPSTLMRHKQHGCHAGQFIEMMVCIRAGVMTACSKQCCARAGFGNGDEAAEAALLARLVQERPVRQEQLLSLTGVHSGLRSVRHETDCDPACQFTGHAACVVTALIPCVRTESPHLR